jgi:nitroreductase
LEESFLSQLELTPDQLLTTTRAVRKRLDLSRPVEIDIVKECIEIATQAPSGSNNQQWHFIIVTDPAKKKGLADLYRQSYAPYNKGVIESYQKELAQNPNSEHGLSERRNSESGTFLAEHLHEVPVLVIPCLTGRMENMPSIAQAASWGSIMPAVWNFMLAARARSLGTVLTVLHLAYEREAAEILGIPYEQITQAALIPVAYTIGTDFKPGTRKSLESIVHMNGW